MRLTEFTSEDKVQYKLKYGKDILEVFNTLSYRFNSFIDEYPTLQKHNTIISDYKSRVDDFLDELINMHNYCLESEDDNETQNVAASVKEMFNKLSEIINQL